MSLDPDDFPFCSDFSVLEKTVEVLVTTKSGDEITIRIEAFRTSNENNRFTTREKIIGTGSEKYKNWNFPWTSGNTADEAIRSSLSFIHDQIA